MYLLVILNPVFSAILVSLFGRYFGRIGCAIISIFSLAIAAITSIFIFLKNFVILETNFELSFLLQLNNWITTNFTDIEFTFYVDAITLTMFVVVLSISTIVHWYSFDYLRNDPHLSRFFAYLSFFTFFMLVLVAANDLIILFIGWEGVGLFSYLLINFWYTRLQANKSALKAIFINKIGDIGMLLAMALIYIACGTTNINILTLLIPYISQYSVEVLGFSLPILNLIAICLFIGALGKSAQLGLHVWLPDAMEGPTPVSALLHAATMVTAGVFLFIRLSVVVYSNSLLALLLVFVGSLTTFFAATTGLFQHDIKRIIAFSTCSQLGYMLVACGLLQPATALFHLFNHAFFKALLFLSAGSIIHALNDEQDIRKFGYLYRFMPLTFSFFTIASFSLMGLPYLSGYYSKDVIIEFSFCYIKLWPFFLVSLSALFTAMYSIRLLFYVFLAAPNFNRSTMQINDARLYVQLPLIFLTFLSIISGYSFSEGFVGIGYNLFTSVFNLPLQHNLTLEIDYIPIYFKQLPFIGSILASILFYKILKHWQELTLKKILRPKKFGQLSDKFISFYVFLNQKWFFDKLYNNFFFFLLKGIYKHFFLFLEKGIFELWGPTGVYNLLSKTTGKLAKVQDGYLTSYLFYIIFCLALLVFFMVPYFIYIL